MSRPTAFWTLGALVLLAACRGPDPAVVRQSLEPAESREAPFRVEAVVANRGRGSGQVGVTAVLTRRDTDEVVAQASQSIELEAHQSANVVFLLPRPSAARNLDAAQLSLRVEAEYPIE